MLLVKESVIKNYIYDDKQKCSVVIEHIKQYHYENENEKKAHRDIMKEQGFEDSGQVKCNIGTVFNPKLKWFGEYYKYTKSMESNIWE